MLVQKKIYTRCGIPLMITTLFSRTDVLMLTEVSPSRSICIYLKKYFYSWRVNILMH